MYMQDLPIYLDGLWFFSSVFYSFQNTDTACILCLKHKYLCFGCDCYINVEKEMATHSSFLAWRILWTERLGGLPSMGLRGRHDWSNLESYINEIRKPLDWSGFNALVPT